MSSTSTQSTSPTATSQTAVLETAALETGSTVRVEPWTEKHFVAWGCEPRSVYAERFWLPIIGPSSFVLSRNIATAFDSNHGPYETTEEHLAASLGLSPGNLRRVFDRLVSFGLAKRQPNSIAIRTHWALISRAMIRQLPQALQQLHGDWHYLTDTTDPDQIVPRTLWLQTVSAHAKSVSVVEFDALLRRTNCPETFRVELIDWMRTTPKYRRTQRTST